MSILPRSRLLTPYLALFDWSIASEGPSDSPQSPDELGKLQQTGVDRQSQLAICHGQLAVFKWIICDWNPEGSERKQWQDIGMCKSMQRKVHKGQCRGFDVGWCRKLKRTLIRTWGRSLKAGSSIWSVWYEAISTWWLLCFTMFMSEWESVCALVSLVLCVDKYVQPPNII